MTASSKAKATVKAYRRSLSLHSRACFKIKTKTGEIVPFEFNAAQVYLHRRLQEQKAETGRIRALVLKGRQQGISTYVAARFYAQASLNFGVNVFILSHEQGASDNLFEIVERYHKNNPLAPHTGASNAKELEFDRLDSRYTVAIAGDRAGGRSRTNKLFHGSEVAFWKSARDHFAASVQTVPDMPGTEVILETTANGVTGEFYERWQQAVAGEGDYIAIFIPWYWQPEYQRDPPPGFEMSTEVEADDFSEAEYAGMFGLTDAQMAWRRAKIMELGGVQTFNQEYPATAQMAFIASDADAFIEANQVLRARKREIEPSGPLVIGADPAGPGGDRFAIAWRRGHCVEKIKFRNKVGTTEALEWLRHIVDEDEPARLYVDAGGIGSAIISAFRDLGPKHRDVIRAVNFGSPSQHKNATPNIPGPKNRRAEMWTRLRDWLALEEGVSIPDDEALQTDLTSVRRKASLTNDTVLESKDEMRRRGIRSPDLADAVALTFADLGHIENYKERKKPVSYGAPDLADTVPVRGPAQGNTRTGWMAG